MNQEIAELKARVAKYETELDSASSPLEKSEIRHTINTRCETLNRLLDEKRKSLPQGEYVFVLRDLFL